MNIQKFSHLAKISAYTIRYYEKIGLFRCISRNSSGHRCFTQEDVTWAEFVNRLKDTGMSLDDIRKYANLREKGIHTSTVRLKMLKEHARKLEDKIDIENTHLRKLKDKINYYKNIETKA